MRIADEVKVKVKVEVEVEVEDFGHLTSDLSRYRFALPRQVISNFGLRIADEVKVKVKVKVEVEVEVEDFGFRTSDL